ncbi:MAG: hypothetical protein HKP58_02775 [Desulfatitalea sp.]|nr:hypothetical protein [Desulfatitalea sp.]NNJ99315.1 hypothetical protein [Desulfatitalea sp.]
MHPNSAILSLNRAMDCLAVPHGVNEGLIERLLEPLERAGNGTSNLYWLSLARLTELTLLCAGHYADNCECCAAGDLLLNPRRIEARRRPDGKPFIKKRHGRLRDEKALTQAGPLPKAALHQVTCLVATPALLPMLHDRLADSGFFGAGYIEEIAARMVRIADTLRFLAAYPVDSNEDLYRRLQWADAGERDFVQRHLCCFTRDHFDRFGRRVEAQAVHHRQRARAGQRVGRFRPGMTPNAIAMETP